MSNCILTLPQLKQMVNNKYIDHWYDAFQQLLPDYDINTPLRVAHFIAQCAHESGGFVFIKENLNYSASGLVSIFGSYFPGNLSELYARQPVKIASRVYGNRMGNGAEETKEGFKFRGRGYIQLTGKENYKAFGAAISSGKATFYFPKEKKTTEKPKEPSPSNKSEEPKSDTNVPKEEPKGPMEEYSNYRKIK